MCLLLLLDIIWNPQKDASRTCMFSVHLYLYVKYLNYIFNKCQSVLYVKQSWFLCQKYKPVILCLSIVQTIHSVLGFHWVSASHFLQTIIIFHYFLLSRLMSFIQIDWSWIQWFNCFQLFYSWATTNGFSLSRFVFRLAFPRLCSLNPFVLPYRTDIGLVPIHHGSFSLSLCLWLSLLLLFVIVGRLAWGNNQYKVECGDLCVNVKTSQKCCQQLNWIGLS